MKVGFICIALVVMAVSSSNIPWETLVCTTNSTCSSTDGNITTMCHTNNDSIEVNVMVGSDICNCNEPCHFIITTDPPDNCQDTFVPNVSLTLNNVFEATTNQSNCLDVQNVTQELIQELTNCTGTGFICWVIVGLGSIIILLLIIILTLCVAITCLLARGKRYQYTPNVVLTQSSTDQNQIQEQPPPSQNQDSGGQQANLYHILDPQYDTVDNKITQPRSEPRSEPVQYCEPEPPIHVQAEVTEQKGLTGSGSQSSKLKASLEQIDEQDTGVFYDELTGPGYPKSLKASEHSATSLPTAVPKYSSLHAEDGTEQKQQNELIALYSMPDKNKKKEKESGKKTRETELSTSQNLMAKPKSPSPPPPELPPKPGQASNVAKNIQEELEGEESAYAEVSSRPIMSASPRNRTPGAIGTTVSPLHLTSHNPSSTEREKGNFRRSYSMEGYFGSEALHHRKASDMDFRRLYDAPMTPSLHTRGMEPPQEDDEERHGFFRAS